MGEYSEIIKLLNEQFAVTKKLPTKIKVNEEWFRLQQFSTWTLNGEENPTLAGIPVEKDSNVKTFEFVYKN